MKPVTITCKGTIKDPNDKKTVLHKFEFDFEGYEVESLSDLPASTALKMVKLQYKIDQLNKQRTAYAKKWLTEQGYIVPKARTIDPVEQALSDIVPKIMSTGTQEEKELLYEQAKALGILEIFEKKYPRE